MYELTIRDMRAALGHLDELVEKSGEIVITKHGHPIARILPMYGKQQRPTHAELRARMKKLATTSAEIIRQERDER